MKVFMREWEKAGKNVNNSKLSRGQFEKKESKMLKIFMLYDLVTLISVIYFKEVIRDKHRCVYKDSIE